jgi:hypothetical protein
MDWLYSSPASQVDREQYLLGKKIDRQVDPLLASEDRERQVHSAVCPHSLAAFQVLLPSGTGQRAWSPVCRM